MGALARSASRNVPVNSRVCLDARPELAIQAMADILPYWAVVSDEAERVASFNARLQQLAGLVVALRTRMSALHKLKVWPSAQAKFAIILNVHAQSLPLDHAVWS